MKAYYYDTVFHKYGAILPDPSLLLRRPFKVAGIPGILTRQVAGYLWHSHEAIADVGVAVGMLCSAEIAEYLSNLLRLQICLFKLAGLLSGTIVEGVDFSEGRKSVRRLARLSDSWSLKRPPYAVIVPARLWAWLQPHCVRWRDGLSKTSIPTGRPGVFLWGRVISCHDTWNYRGGVC